MDISTNEDKVVKPDGSSITRKGIVQESINYYKEAYQSNLTEICDFSDGSEIRTLHESIAVDVFSLYKELLFQAKMKFVNYATGTWLDELACEVHLSRKKSEVARGTVTFYTSATVTGVIQIPKGTVILARHTGYEYILAEDVTIDSPDTPVNGSVYSKLTGEKYNAPPDKLTAFANIASIRSEIRVTNPTPIIDGVDEESDEEFRKRILDAKREKAHGTVPSYFNLLVNDVPDIHDVEFVYPDLLASDEKYARHYKNGVTEAKIKNKTFQEQKKAGLLCTTCTAVIFINAHSKPCPDHVIEDAEYVITQQNNLVVGHKFHLEKAQTIPIYLSVELFVVNTIDEDTLFEYLTAYFNGESVETSSGQMNYTGLNIGETLYKSKLIDVIETIPGVYQAGNIKLAKYNPDIPKEELYWVNHGDANYTYEDDDGFVYYRKNSDKASIEYWGTKNFISLETHEGSVFQLAQFKDVDESTEKIIDIQQYLPDGKSPDEEEYDEENM